MMHCRQFQDQVFEHLDGSLSAPAQSASEAHLDQCAACRQVVQAHQALAARFRHETDSLVLQPDMARRIEAALADLAPGNAHGRESALRRQLLKVAQTSKSAVPQVSKPADRRQTWKSAAQQVWKPALRHLLRLAWPAAIAAALFVAAGLSFYRPWRQRPLVSEAAPRPAGASIAIRFVSYEPAYTFRRENNLVIDSLTSAPRVVEENLWLPPLQQPSPQTQERKTSL
jgi:anti-sigma factor RsiW